MAAAAAVVVDVVSAADLLVLFLAGMNECQLEW